MVAIGDIHFGPRIDFVSINLALEKVVYPHIESTDPDMIVILGDDTDTRISLDMTCARHYLIFQDKITSFKHRDKSPIPVRFISGTREHQKNQLQARADLVQDPGRDVKMYETVGTELFKDCKILYIPEEPVTSKKQYYHEFLYNGQRYDLCFGHGMFSHIGRNGWGLSEERSLRSSPVWDTDDFKNISGGVYFGHVHIAQSYKNRVWYSGSLSCFSQGEEAHPKGFLSIYHNTETKKHRVDFIKNEYAPRYITKELSQTESAVPVEELISRIITLIHTDNIYELRYIIAEGSMDVAKYRVLRRYFQDNRGYRVRFEIRRREVKQNDITASNQSSPEDTVTTQGVLSNRFPGITNPGDFYGNTVEYARIAYNTELTKERIDDIIAKCNAYQ